MNVLHAQIPEIFIIEPTVLTDRRGYFYEIYQEARYASHGITGPFVQENFSRSSQGVLRGLHLQNPRAQGKLISVLRGRVLDVVVDVRLGSPTFLQHIAVELTDENRRQMWVPRGFAHGFLVLSKSVDFFYKCDEYYSPADEIAVRWNDPTIGINWGIADPSLSARDATAPLLADVLTLPVYDK